MGDGDGPLDPGRFREYLMVLARVQLARSPHRKLEASDVVQATLLEAHRKRDQFRGGGPAEMAGWLRRMLACNLVDAGRALGRARRDSARERSLEDQLGDSSALLGAILAAPQSTPSRAAERHEQAVLLADALARLPDSQREALTLRHCQGLALEEIGRRMDRTPAAVAGLLKRGLRQLRTLMEEG